ncbi:MAG: selenium cofactor biosynthesis protein YqeC [Lachnospiraceae bacterium]|nr:selenium cofactor biosynthesis protein YqeC [Lachnospiraceae bacterium]
METETSVLTALDIEEKSGCMISMVGGGGKTSLLFRLCKEWMTHGKTVIITTTTQMYYEPDCPYADWGESETIREQIDECGYVMVGQNIFTDPEGGKAWKLQGISAEQISSLRPEADVILVEADGARHKPLKMPARWEPVVPRDSDYVIGVMGLQALGKPMEQACHRPERAAEFLKKQVTERITKEDMLALALSSRALRKHCVGEYRVYINQVDCQAHKEVAAEFLKELEKNQIKAAAGCSKDVAVILLAAGNSTRFGENKLRYTIDNEPMYRHIVKKCLKLPVFRWIMVTQYDEIQQELQETPMEVVRNTHPNWGISHSIHLGVTAATHADAYLFAVCDQPYVSLHTLENLLESYRRERYGLAAVCYEDRWGNPNIFSAKYRKELLALQGDVGGKRILLAHQRDMLAVSVSEEQELKDLDKKEELL